MYIKKQKQTHRYRVQTSSYEWGEGRGRGERESRMDEWQETRRPPGARLRQRIWRITEDVSLIPIQGSCSHLPGGGLVITGNQFRPEGICTSLP